MLNAQEIKQFTPEDFFRSLERQDAGTSLDAVLMGLLLNHPDHRNKANETLDRLIKKFDSPRGIKEAGDFVNELSLLVNLTRP